MNNKLIGKTIQQVLIDEEKYVLVFKTNDGDYIYATYGDCCNDVWFNHIDGVDALIGGTVIDVDQSSWEEAEATRDYCDEIAFWTIKTNKGYSKIEVRNSHNGYYGGYVCEIEEVNKNVVLDLLTKDF